MTLDQIDRLVRQANPVPDLAALEPIDASVLEEQRRMDMQTHDRVIVDREPAPSRRNWLMGIAAAVVVIVGAVLVFQLRSDTPVAGQPRTAVEIATVFVEAYGAFDFDQATSYLASDAELWLGDLEEVRLENRLLEAQGFQLLLDSCEQVNTTSNGIVVRCSWDFHAIRSQEMGLGPFSGSWFGLTVRDGEIVAASMNWDYMAEFSPQVWEPFSQWVADNYPEDVDVMYLPNYSNYRLSEESIALWEQRSREYAEAMAG